MGIFNNASIKVEGRKVYINGDAITFESEAEATEFVLELTKRLIQDR